MAGCTEAKKENIGQQQVNQAEWGQHIGNQQQNNMKEKLNTKTYIL